MADAPAVVAVRSVTFGYGREVVLDGRTKEILAWINGSREFDDYRTAIDAALGAP